MNQLQSPDGRFLFALQDDGNEVIYDTHTDPWTPVWDRWSFEAKHEITPKPKPTPTPAPSPTPNANGVICVTKDSPGEFLDRDYSYWSQSVVRGTNVYTFVGHSDGTVKFFEITTDERVTPLGSLLAYAGTGEGWYWNANGQIYLLDGPRLRRVNPFITGHDEVVFDIADTHPGCRLWQAHSSDDGRAHSATVQKIVAEGAYPNIGTVVCIDGVQRYFPAIGSLDESAITADGKFLVIKEDDYNRVINLVTGVEQRLYNEGGAVGHSDCGESYIIGEDDVHGACVRWDFPAFTRTELFKTWNMGHVAVRGDRWLLSDDKRISLMDANGQLTTLVEHGMIGSGYDFQVFANLSPDGRVATWMSNKSGRMDAYILMLGGK